MQEQPYRREPQLTGTAELPQLFSPSPAKRERVGVRAFPGCVVAGRSLTLALSQREREMTQQYWPEGFSWNPCPLWEGHPKGVPFGLARLAVTQQLARVSARTLAVLKGHLTIDHDPAIPLRPLHPPPIIRRHIVHDLPRQNVQLVEIVDQNVRRQPFAQA